MREDQTLPNELPKDIDTSGEESYAELMSWIENENKKSQPETIARDDVTISQETPIKELQEEPQIETELSRETQLGEVRKQLGINKPNNSNDNLVLETKDALKEEEIGSLSTSLNQLKESVDELMRAFSKNKFSRVKFDTDLITNTVSEGDINSALLADNLKDLSNAFHRIRLPEDKRDLMNIGTRDFQLILSKMEKTEDQLRNIRRSFSDARQGDYREVVNITNSITSNLSRQRDYVQNALTLLKRYLDN